jgi:hypothetical protein
MTQAAIYTEIHHFFNMLSAMYILISMGSCHFVAEQATVIHQPTVFWLVDISLNTIPMFTKQGLSFGSSWNAVPPLNDTAILNLCFFYEKLFKQSEKGIYFEFSCNFCGESLCSNLLKLISKFQCIIGQQVTVACSEKKKWQLPIEIKICYADNMLKKWWISVYTYCSLCHVLILFLQIKKMLSYFLHMYTLSKIFSEHISHLL